MPRVLLDMAFPTFKVRANGSTTLVIASPTRLSKEIIRICQTVVSDTNVIFDSRLLKKADISLISQVAVAFDFIYKIIEDYQAHQVIVIPDNEYVAGFQIQAVRRMLGRTERPFSNRLAVAGLIDRERGSFEDATRYIFHDDVIGGFRSMFGESEDLREDLSEDDLP